MSKWVLGFWLLCLAVILSPYVTNGESPLSNEPDSCIVRDHKETESAVSVSPVDGNVVLVSNNNRESGGGTSGWISTDGGLTWSGSVVVSDGLDPACVIQRRGSSARFIVGAAGADQNMVTYHKDDGATVWHESDVWTPGEDERGVEMPRLWATTYEATAYEPRVYCGWGTRDAIYVATSDSGVTWPSVSPITLTISNGDRRYGICGATNHAGLSFAVWAVGYGQDLRALGFSKSDDGGDTWSAEENLQTIDNGTEWECSLYPSGIDVTLTPAMAIDQTTNGQGYNDIYVVYPAKSGSYLHIYLKVSHNNGASWVGRVNPIVSWKSPRLMLITPPFRQTARPRSSILVGSLREVSADA
jgi:hypothetical protein